MTTYRKPLPTFDSVSEPFWDGAKRHELMIQRCKACGKNIFYPRAVCPWCMALSDKIEWVKSGGKGRVYSFTTVMQASNPGFRGEEPYIYAIIELNEGVRLSSNVINCKPEDCKVDMPVEVVFEDVTPEFTLPKFQPIK